MFVTEEVEEGGSADPLPTLYHHHPPPPRAHGKTQMVTFT